MLSKNNFSAGAAGHSGEHFDSKAEAAVSDVLWDLQKARVIDGFFHHTVLSGVEIDFLVQLSNSTPDAHLRRTLVVLEYDGMSIWRPHDLEPKIERLALLAVHGVQTRWVLDASFDAVKEALTDYTPPRLVRRRAICPDCHATETALVFARASDLGRLVNDADEVELPMRCVACAKPSP